MNRTRNTGTYRGTREFTPFHMLVGIFCLLAVIVIGALVFSPDKPPAPPPSRLSFDEPTADTAPALFHVEAEGDWSQEDSRRAVVEEVRAGQALGSDDDPILVYGVVTDATTGEPIKDVVVSSKRDWTQEDNDTWKEAFSSDNADAADRLKEAYDAVRTAVTNEEGRYAFRVPLPGNYSIIPHREGYVDTDSVTGRSIVDGETEVRVDFTLSRGASVAGRVTERDTSLPAKGVRVWLTNQDQGAYAWAESTTDANGEYKIQGLRPGEYVVSLHLGDSPYQFAGLPPRRLVPVTSPSQEVNGVDFTVDPAGVVWGYVKDESGSPVNRVYLVLCNSDSVVSQVLEAATRMREPVGGRTNRDGFYRVMGVPFNREARLYAYPDGYSPQLSEPFLLTSKQRTARVDIFLSPGTTIYGRVYNSVTGAPVVGAEVRCMPGLTKLLAPFDAPAGFRDTRSKDDGSYVIPHLPSGQHALYVFKENFKVSLSGEPVFSDGHNDLRVDLSLTPVDAGEFAVYGTVMEESGRVIPEARVELVSMGGLAGGGRDTRSDQNGQFFFQGVEAGMLMLNVNAEGYAPKTVSKVNLDAPTNVVLESKGGVTGEVVIRETGETPESYTVQAIPTSTEGDLFGAMGGVGGQSFTSADRTFSLSLPAGDYTLIASSPGLTSGRVDVTVEASKSTDAGTIYVRQNGGRISGRVVTRDGRSPAGAMVSCGLDGGASFAELLPMLEEQRQLGFQVGENGAFEFKNLSAGNYRVTATLIGYAQGASGTIALGDGKSVTGVDVILGSGGKLFGYVSRGGRIVPGAVITLVGRGVNKTATTDRTGQYAIEEIPAGDYLASAVILEEVQGGNFSPIHKNVTISDGQSVQCDFTDAEGTTITGLCTPPPNAGEQGFAVLRIAGMGDEIATLNLRDIVGMFASEDLSVASYLVGMGQLDRDGYFEILNAPQGTYSLDIFYVNIAQLMTGGARRTYSQSITIQGEPKIELNIAVPTS